MTVETIRSGVDLSHVDRGVRPVVDTKRELLRAGGGGDDTRTQAFADLDRRGAHAARGPEDEQRLARLQPGAVDQGVHGRRVGEQERRADLERHALGELRGGRLGHHDLLGESTRPLAEDHLVTDRPARDAFAQRENLAGRFNARRERQLGLVLVAACHHQHVGKIQRRRAHADQHLARRGRRRRQVDDLQNRRIAQGLAQDCAHR